MTSQPDLEVTSPGGLVCRRIVVGPLDTNCWIVHRHPDDRAVVIDPGDEPERILAAADDVTVVGIVLSHTHWDHVLAVPALVDAWAVAVAAHGADAPVWDHEREVLATLGHWDAGTATARLLESGHPLAPGPDEPLWDGAFTRVGHGDPVGPAGLGLRAWHTPGHTPGGISILGDAVVFSGDTLFPGGPGLTGWPLSDFTSIMVSVRSLLALPAETVVHPGHGPDTTIGRERPSVEEWQRRGW